MGKATFAKVVALLAAGGIVALWLLLATAGVGAAGGPSGPAVPPVLLGVVIFGALAVTGGVAALRDAPVVTALCGGIGLVPVGLYTLLMPWPYRLIGVLDLALVGAGVLLLRSGDPGRSASPSRSDD